MTSSQRQRCGTGSHTEPVNDKAWLDLLDRRNAWKEKLQRVKQEIDEATIALERLDFARSLKEEKATHKNYSFLQSNYQVSGSDVKELLSIEAQTKHRHVGPRNFSHSDTYKLTACDSTQRVNHSGYACKVGPSAQNCLENKLLVSLDSLKRNQKSSDEYLYQEPSPVARSSPDSIRYHQVPSRFKNDKKSETTKPISLDINHHSSERLVFEDDFLCLFSRQLNKDPCHAHISSSATNFLQLPEIKIQPLLDSNQFLVENNQLRRADEHQQSEQFNVATSVSTKVSYGHLLLDDKTNCQFVNNGRQGLDSADKNNNYKLSLGIVENSEMDEDKELESVKLLSVTKSDKSDCNEVTKIPNLFKIPINLLQRWGHLYKTADDSESDSESEYEEDDPSSPYCPETTLDITQNSYCWEFLNDFTTIAFNAKEKFVQNFNEKSGLTNVEVKDEIIRHSKTKEVLNLVEASWNDEGVRHGFYRYLDPDGKEVKLVGRYIHGEKCGVCWKKMDGNSFVVNSDDSNNNQVHGVYLYPDLCCAIKGTYEEQRLKYGHFGKVEGVFDDKSGFPFPQVRILDPSVSFTYDPSMSVLISKSPLVRDPYEHQTVYVKKSTIPFAGEGLFAKRFLPAGTLVALFNGIRQRESGFIKNPREFSDYRIGLGTGEICLDIPEPYTSLKKYSATLAHKACHSFNPNSAFKEFFHPRFGRIMSIVTDADVHIHQEILVSYNYRIHQAPAWYQSLYFTYLREDKKMSEESIYLTARRIARDHGVSIAIPPPSRSSSRFLACGICNEHVGFDTLALACDKCTTWYHVRCTDVKQEDVFEENEFGHKIPKIDLWTCMAC